MPITTWDPANKGANVTLSGGNLTATITSTATNSTHGSAGYAGNSASLLYYEATAATVPGGSFTWGIGIAATTTVLNDYIGGQPTSIGLYQSGNVYNNTLAGSTIFSFVTGAVIGIAVDCPHQKIWFTANGTTWNNAAIGSQNPATNTGGIIGIGNNNPWVVSGVYNTVVPCFGSAFTSGGVATANFGATAFAYSVPAGFQAWNGAAAGAAQARALVLA